MAMRIADIAMAVTSIAVQTDNVEGIAPFEEVRRQFLRKRREQSSETGAGEGDASPAKSVAVARAVPAKSGPAAEPANTTTATAIPAKAPTTPATPVARLGQDSNASSSSRAVHEALQEAREVLRSSPRAPSALAAEPAAATPALPRQPLPNQPTVPAPAQAAITPVRKRAGNRTGYFEMLGNISGRWSTVDGQWKRSSASGKLYMREIPRCGDESEGMKYFDDMAITHTAFWFDLFLKERSIHGRYDEFMPLTEIADIVMTHQHVEIPARAVFYPLKHERRPLPPVTEHTRYYYHGSYFQTIWQITEQEEFMDSVHGSGDGHEAGTPGLYCSDQFGYSLQHYGWACQVFGDGMFYRCGYLVMADHLKVRQEKRRGQSGHEIVYPAASVYIVGLVIFPDSHVPQGTPRFYNFDLGTESWPPGVPHTPPRAVTVGMDRRTRLINKWDSQWSD